jgi:hypothetical protein
MTIRDVFASAVFLALVALIALAIVFMGDLRTR